LIERPAHRASRRVEGDCELTLGRQPVALAIGSGFDGAPEIGRDGADAVVAPLQIRRQGLACRLNAWFGQRVSPLWIGPLWALSTNWFTLVWDHAQMRTGS